MERQKILNPLTGRMVYADGAVAKSIPKMKKSVGVLEGAVKRTGTTKIAEKKEAVGKLSGAIKRTLAKKPEPKKVYGWEDLPNDIKYKISGIVRQNKVYGWEDLPDDIKDKISGKVRQNKIKDLIKDIKDNDNLGDKQFEITEERNDKLQQIINMKPFMLDENIEGGDGDDDEILKSKNEILNIIKREKKIRLTLIIVDRASRASLIQSIIDRFGKKEVDKLGGIKNYPIINLTYLKEPPDRIDFTLYGKQALSFFNAFQEDNNGFYRGVRVKEANLVFTKIDRKSKNEFLWSEPEYTGKNRPAPPMLYPDGDISYVGIKEYLFGNKNIEAPPFDEYRKGGYDINQMIKKNDFLWDYDTFLWSDWEKINTGRSSS
jgi:hypothetical protein